MRRSEPRLASLPTALILLFPSMLLVLAALSTPEACALSVPASPVVWLKNPGNPVLGPGTAPAFDSQAVFSNAVLRSEGKYFLYYTGYSGAGSNLGLATSTDGKLFTKYAGNPIIAGGANCSVIRDGAGFRMWYAGNDGVRLATSSDGRFWTDHQSSPVLGNGQPPAWDSVLRSASVLRDGDIYKMWYSGGDGDDVRIGYATSTDGVLWTKYAGNPVLAQEASWETANVRSPCVLRVSGEYRMWYSASDGRYTRICYANSTDGIGWLKYPQNPLMPASAAWETPNNLCPAVFYDGRDLRLWYSGADNAFRARIGYAESAGTGPFAPVPLAPADNLWTNGSRPVFNWSLGAGGGGQSAFRVQIDDSLDFSSPQVDTGPTLSENLSWAAEEPLPDGAWYWRVMVRDSVDDESPWSEIRALRIDTASPSITAIALNGGAAFTNSTTVRLSLNASDPVPGSGLSGMRYRYNGTEWTGWMPPRNDVVLELAGADRLWTVTVEVRDAVGNIGPEASAGILVDTMPPVATGLLINEGAPFTGNRTVRLALSAGDPPPGTGVAVMAFSNDGAAWSPWEPFSAERAWNLTAGDGLKTVGVRFRDLAGNAGAPLNSSLVLDATPPATSLLRSPPVSEVFDFSVSWMAQDALSGVGGSDIEYRPDDGPWTPWLNATNLTTSTFTGQDGIAYSFRARSFDRVGNLEPFPAGVSMTVRVVLPRPEVAIADPVPQKIIGGKYPMAGGSSHPKAGTAITLVEVSIDGGPWLPATGTLSWAYTLDTTKLKNGMHNVSARSFDGVKYSDTAVTAFRVQNEPPSSSPDMLPFIAVIVVVAAGGAVASLLVLRGRKRPPAPGGRARQMRPPREPAPNEPAPQAPDPAAPIPQEPSPQAPSPQEPSPQAPSPPPP